MRLRPLALTLALAAAPSAPAAPPEAPALPARAELVRAIPFTLDAPARRPGGEPASSGLVLEIRAAPSLTRTRQAAMPVLQLGRFVAMPASVGADGRLLAVVLGDADLASSELFFGEPELVERVGDADALARLSRAQVAGIPALGAEAAAHALAAGGPPLRARDFAGLSPALARLRCALEPDALAARGAPCDP